MELFRDTIWQFVGVLISILAIVITIAIFFMQKSKKELTWILLSKSPLLNVKSKDITLLYNGVNVDSVYITEIKIINTGNVPILPTDYIEKVGIIFSESNLTLSAEVTKTEPDTINTSFEIEDDKVLMNSILLNPKDSINFRLLTRKSYDEFKIAGRIVGIKGVKKQAIEQYLNTDFYKIIFNAGGGALIVGIISLGAALILDWSGVIVAMYALTSGFVLMLLAKWLTKLFFK